MRKGGGKKKGGLYEKKIAKILSKWWAPKIRNALWRSRGSGAEYTVLKRGREEYPGDIVPVKLEATRGWKLAIECKNTEQWKFEHLMKNPFKKTLIGKWWLKLSDETPHKFYRWLVISRNHDLNYLIVHRKFSRQFKLKGLKRMSLPQNLHVYRLEDVLKQLSAKAVKKS